MLTNYKGDEHYEKMDTLFPGGITHFSEPIGDTGLAVTVTKGKKENEGGVLLVLEYAKDLLPEDIVARLDERKKYFMACKTSLFFYDKTVTLPSIQGQSFSDQGAMALLMANKSMDISSDEAFQQLQNDYAQHGRHVQNQLLKKVGIPLHDFMFLLASLVGVSLGGHKIAFLRKDFSPISYTRQSIAREQILQSRIPLLSDSQEHVYRTQQEIVDYIANLAEKPRTLLFSVFDALGEYKNTLGACPFKGLPSHFSGELIYALRQARRRAL